MADAAEFILVLVTSADAFIARAPGHPPWEWQSPEEQAFFLDTVAAADWSIMGRVTHETAFRPERRRIVFSHSACSPDWRAPTHLWIDPGRQTPDDLVRLVEPVRPMRTGLILGGADVAEWFLSYRRIDRVLLSIEPVEFGAGLPAFPGGEAGDPVALLASLGFDAISERPLNETGTRLLELAPQGRGEP